MVKQAISRVSLNTLYSRDTQSNRRKSAHPLSSSLLVWRISNSLNSPSSRSTLSKVNNHNRVKRDMGDSLVILIRMEGWIRCRTNSSR